MIAVSKYYILFFVLEFHHKFTISIHYIKPNA